MQPRGQQRSGSPLELLLPRVLAGLWQTAAISQAAGLLLCLAFFYLILGLGRPGLLSLLAWIGPLLAFMVLGWSLIFARLLKPLRSLGRRAEGSSWPGPGDACSETRCEEARGAAHELPYRAAAASFLLWLLLEAALGVVGSVLWGDPAARWAGMVFGAFVISFGSTVYQLTVQRLLLRPLLEQLSTGIERHRPGPRPVLYSLRFKMILSFTALVFFSCAFALFLSFHQSQELIDRLQGVSSSARLRLLRSIVRQGQDPELGPDEALVLLGARGEVLRHWGERPEQRSLDSLATAGEGSISLGVRGLTATALGMQSEDSSPGTLRLFLLAPRPPVATRSLRMLIFFMSLMFLGAAGLVHLSSREISTPIQRLSDLAREMASGRLDRPVPVGEADEIGVLSEAFETMRSGLKEKLETIEELNATLEAKVHLRTRELENALELLKASQTQLVQSEKMASLGQLVAGVAHEINNPVNYIINTLEPLEEMVGEMVAALDAYREGNQQGAARLVREAKLGQAAADAMRMLQVMRNGADRTRRIVADLRSFSRLDEAELKEVRLEEGFESTLNLLGPSIAPGVRVETSFELEQPVLCYAGQLNQVFMNLLNNAVQAVGEQGHIRVSTCREGSWAVMTVEDDGPGVPEEIRQRVFDPFFSTKEVGQGTGLGLSISLGIIQRHGGTITCGPREAGEPQDGTGERPGALFRMSIPIDGPGKIV